MTQKRVILVTGVAEGWGTRVTEKLLEQPDYYVIGLDSEEPKQEIKGLDFIQADVRNPLLVDLFESEQVDTVCHLKFVDSVQPTETSFDINVMGTMKVLGACAEAGVRKVVLKSSTAVYGAQPMNSAYLSESHPLNGSRSYEYMRDQVEIEAFCNGFRRQVPQMIQTTLRFANIVGPNADSPMIRFLKEPYTPALLGFDPMFQIIHENDVIDALVYAVNQDVPGVFNVAAPEIMPFSRLIALAGKIGIPIFHLFAYWGVDILGVNNERVARYFPIELDYLRYPCVGDLAKMREELGFLPRYTAEETLREFAGTQRLRRYLPESRALAYDEQRLRDTINRRQRAKAGEENKPFEPAEDEIHE